MQYQGSNKIYLELQSNYAIELDLELVTKTDEYYFDVSHLTYFDNSVYTEISLVNKPYNLQRDLITEAAEAVDNYVSKYHERLLQDLADQAYLELLDAKNNR